MLLITSASCLYTCKHLCTLVQKALSLKRYSYLTGDVENIALGFLNHVLMLLYIALILWHLPLFHCDKINSNFNRFVGISQ